VADDEAGGEKHEQTPGAGFAPEPAEFVDVLFEEAIGVPEGATDEKKLEGAEFPGFGFGGLGSFEHAGVGEEGEEEAGTLGWDEVFIAVLEGFDVSFVGVAYLEVGDVFAISQNPVAVWVPNELDTTFQGERLSILHY
jgi:hypothetical protein